MKALLLREIKSFFGSPIGYLVIALFLIITGLFLWVFEGDFNILKGGFADITPFFTIAPWILIFLIPAVTMKSFSDEKKQGTIELLLTKPLHVWEIVGGKFLGAFTLIVIAILPTLIYVYVIDQYSFQEETLDLGSTIGSYIGLLFLIAGYAAIGIFTSTLSENQIVSFITAVFLCFLMYYGLEAAAGLFGEWGDLISKLGMEAHFKSMGRGVLDSRDLLYFVSVAVIFLAGTVYKLKSMNA